MHIYLQICDSYGQVFMFSPQVVVRTSVTHIIISISLDQQNLDSEVTMTSRQVIGSA